ncbi:hypothetical protein EVAR_13878_1 [Eumeta japonica]|uniref:Uncharacterized protein n=1 Tax=Eumeta variegata TaxID=151549 RepID=A0A4C1U2P6_EUMVA|nr:hypothetical protein EVAR_13878_1 [Eumeta japonica]
MTFSVADCTEPLGDTLLYCADVGKVREKQPRSRIPLHQGNASPCTASKTMSFSTSKKVKLVTRPSFDADLAPCDFFIYPKIKDLMRGLSFTGPEEAVIVFDQHVQNMRSVQCCPVANRRRDTAHIESRHEPEKVDPGHLSVRAVLLISAIHPVHVSGGPPLCHKGFDPSISLVGGMDAKALREYINKAADCLKNIVAWIELGRCESWSGQDWGDVLVECTVPAVQRATRRAVGRQRFVLLTVCLTYTIRVSDSGGGSMLVRVAFDRETMGSNPEQGRIDRIYVLHVKPCVPELAINIDDYSG